MTMRKRKGLLRPPSRYRFPDAHTGVRAVADLDGDQQPDFLVEVDDATFLLLSTHARPGPNVPTAEMGGGC